jgi:hypothetical protein
MAIIVEQRTRAVNTDPWGNWSNTDVDSVTDGTFTDTDTTQFRIRNTSNVSAPDLTGLIDSALNSPTTINIADITQNLQATTNSEGDVSVSGDGYFDDLMETINTQLKAQYDSGRITGVTYANVYTALFQTALGQAMQFALNKRARELAADTQAVDVARRALELDVADATQQYKIDQQAAQLNKTQAETSYIEEQETQLVASVGFNNKIKAIDTMGDTFGTFGAGGLTVSANMWSTYFGLINDLTGATVPASTTVTKVT